MLCRDGETPKKLGPPGLGVETWIHLQGKLIARLSATLQVGRSFGSGAVSPSKGIRAPEGF